MRKTAVLAEALASLAVPSTAPAGRDLAARLDRLGPLKKHSALIASLAPPGCEDRARRQLDCGCWLLFRKALQGPFADQARLHMGIHCDQQTCPLCMTRRAAKVGEAYLPKVLMRWGENYPVRRALFVTFTVRNQPSLRPTFKTLTDGLTLLNGRRRQARHEGYGPFANLVGGVGHIEVKRGKGGNWHPHYHGLWLHDGRADFKAMRDAWCEIVGYSAQVKIKHLHTQNAMLRGEELPDVAQSLRKDMCEVIKYPIKFEGSPADLWNVAASLRDVRRLRSFGCLHGVKLPDDLVDTPIDWEAWPFVELLFKYAGRGRYAAHNKSRREPSFDAWNAGL